MGDLFGVILNVGYFLLIIYIISRIAHHFNNTKIKLNVMDKKLDEIKESISQENKK
jgi:hypothetical protein